MKLLITGGAGYVGSATCESLIESGCDVVIFDNLVQGHREAIPVGATFIHGDLADPAAIESAIAEHQPGGVMHFAAHSLVGESMEDPLKYLGDNVANATHLLRAMLAHDVRHFVFSSTANLFGDPQRIPISEDETIHPGSAYGESKYLIERILPWLEKTAGLRYACLRYFNAAGATPTRGESHSPETHLIPLVLQVALGQRDHIKIFGDDYDTPDGTCIRDYIHISDLASAHQLAFQQLETVSCSYNLGNGTGFSVLEVIHACREVTGHPIPVVTEGRRAGDVARLVADSSAIRDTLGWETQFPEIRDIVQSAWDWHRSHPNGYQ